MKTFSVAVAVAVVLTFICLQESSAASFTEVQELEEPMSNGSPVAAHEEMAEESWKMSYASRRWRCRKCYRCCIRMRG
ncbi:hepcidin-like isoform X3 [Pagrus major]|uniref:hepcidin-like isoform X3 n=1 Tax=Pagrus major TaxID=143350 RepID=UPI003CC84B72